MFYADMMVHFPQGNLCSGFREARAGLLSGSLAYLYTPKSHFMMKCVEMLDIKATHLIKPELIFEGGGGDNGRCVFINTAVC